MELPEEPTPALPPSSDPAPAKLGFTLSRDRVALTDLLSRASEAWSRDLASWVLAMILYGLLGMGVPIALNMVWGIVSGIASAGGEAGAMFKAVDVVVQIVLSLIQAAIGGVFALGFWAMAIRGLHGKPATIGALFSQLSKVWKYIVQMLVLGLGGVLVLLPIVIVIWLMFVGPVDLNTPMNEIVDDAGKPFAITIAVLFPVYVYVMLGLSFVQSELAFNDDAGPIDAIIYSWKIAKGQRLRIFGIGLLAGLVAMGSLMLCGIGILFGAPLTILLLGALYLGLRNGADVPAPNTTTTLGR